MQKLIVKRKKKYLIGEGRVRMGVGVAAFACEGHHVLLGLHHLAKGRLLIVAATVILVNFFGEEKA